MQQSPELVDAFYSDLWNQWDDTAVTRVLAADFEFRGPLGNEVVGHEGWRQYRDLVRAGAHDFSNEVIDLVADGDRAAARLRYTGTHTGSLLGYPATG